MSNNPESCPWCGRDVKETILTKKGFVAWQCVPDESERESEEESTKSEVPSMFGGKAARPKGGHIFYVPKESR